VPGPVRLADEGGRSRSADAEGRVRASIAAELGGDDRPAGKSSKCADCGIWHEEGVPCPEVIKKGGGSLVYQLSTI